MVHELLQSNISTTAPLGTEESGRCGKVPVIGRQECNMVDFLREYNIFIVLISCLRYSIMVLQSYIIHRRDKIHKKSNIFFESKCLDVTKRARFAAFAISIVD